MDLLSPTCLAPLETVWKPKFQPPPKMKAPEFTGASKIQYGGGGGNRTRVREPSDKASTYIAYVLNSPLQTPTGRIPEELAYGDSPLTL